MGYGAQQDHTTGTGNFAGLDDSSPMGAGMEASLLTPYFDLSNLLFPTIYFYYQNVDDGATGVADISALHVDVYDGTTWTYDVLVITEEVNAWTEFMVNIGSYGDVVQLRFRGITSDNYLSDPSVDDFRVDEQRTNDLSVSGLTPFGAFYANYAGDYPEVLVTNAGTNDQATYYVNISITDASTGTNVYTETVSNPGAIVYGADLTVTMTTLWEPAPGTYSLTATVILAGDENMGNNVTTSNVTVFEWYRGDNDIFTSTYLGSSAAYSGTYGELLFSIGGNGGTGVEVNIYDINTQTWTTTTSVPEATVVGCSAGYGDKIFTQIGASANCYSFDMGTETWTPTASLPEALRWTAATTVGENIYLAGGLDGADGASVYRYDTNTDTWTTTTSMPIDAWGGDLITVGDKIVYVWGSQGGYLSGNAYIGEIDADDPDLISWTTTTAPAEFGAYKITAAPLSNTSFIVTAGDYDANWNARPNTYVYNIITETWTRVADKPTPVLGYAAGSFFIDDEVQYMVSTGYNSGNQTLSEYYLYDVLTPMPVTYLPTVDAIDVESDAPISVTFNMDVLEAYSGIISINGVPATYTLTGNTLEIDHADFEYSTTYTVTVDAGIVMNTDLTGTTNEYFEWTFTTMYLTYAVTFDVEAGDGTIIAEVNDSEITSGDEVTGGSEVVFTATPDAGWQVADWYFNTTAVSSTDLTYTIASLDAVADVTVEFEEATGTYTVNFTVTDEASNPVEGVQIEMLEAVRTTATTNDQGVATFDLVAAGAYTWEATMTDWTTQEGTFTVPGEVDIAITNFTAVGITDLNSNISIYPNPSNGMFTVSVNGTYNLQVIDLTGKVISEQEIANTEDINLKESGVYMLRLTNDVETLNYKVIVK